MPAQIIEIFATGYGKDGSPVSGGTVEVYEAGTSTPAAVWYDRAKTDPTAGGVTSFDLDTQGRCIVYGDDLYKFVIKDADGVTVETIDDAEYAVTPATVAAASTTVAGKVELTTNTEAIDGVDTTRAVTAAALTAKLAVATVNSANKVLGIRGYKTYAGYVQSGGTATLPAGWSINKTGTGVYVITHGLNSVGGAADFSVVFGSQSSPSEIMYSAPPGNDFTVNTYTINTTTPADKAFAFVLFDLR
jgi:hypothetical protein